MNLNLRATHVLFMIMLVAYLLRVLLVVNGGQFYFPDEGRYLRVTTVAETLYEANFRGALDRLLLYNKHHGFTTAGLIPAIIHRTIFHLNPPQYYSWTTYWAPRDNDYRISALVFAIPSVLMIGMIYLIARRAGASETEALLGAFLMGASNTFFIFSKHFLPYDMSLLIGLAALWLAIHNRDANLKHAIVVGMVTFLCLWVYYGHVTFVLMIALIYCVFLASKPRTLVIRASGMAIGAMSIAMPILLYNKYVFNIDVISEALAFSATVNQGDFAEGIVFPFLFFGNAEAGIALVWFIGLVMAGWKLRCQWNSNDRRRALLWFACLIALYGLMTLFSTVLQWFVVLSRIARTMAPFLVLLSAYAFMPLLMSRGRRAVLAFVAAVSIFALLNFVPAIQQEYIIEVAKRVEREYVDVSYETTLSYPARPYGVYGDENLSARYKLVNAGYFFPITELVDRPRGEVLLKVAHPYNHRPWQYGGMTSKMREIINRDGLYIWLIDKGPSAET